MAIRGVLLFSALLVLAGMCGCSNELADEVDGRPGRIFAGRIDCEGHKYEPMVECYGVRPTQHMVEKVATYLCQVYARIFANAPENAGRYEEAYVYDRCMVRIWPPYVAAYDESEPAQEHASDGTLELGFVDCILGEDVDMLVRETDPVDSGGFIGTPEDPVASGGFIGSGCCGGCLEYKYSHNVECHYERPTRQDLTNHHPYYSDDPPAQEEYPRFEDWFASDAVQDMANYLCLCWATRSRFPQEAKTNEEFGKWHACLRDILPEYDGFKLVGSG